MSSQENFWFPLWPAATAVIGEAENIQRILNAHASDMFSDEKDMHVETAIFPHTGGQYSVPLCDLHAVSMTNTSASQALYSAEPLLTENLIAVVTQRWNSEKEFTAFLSAIATGRGGLSPGTADRDTNPGQHRGQGSSNGGSAEPGVNHTPSHPVQTDDLLDDKAGYARFV